MNKVAIAFSTRDKTEQVRRVVEPLLQPEKFDLWWADGSKTPAGQALQHEHEASIAIGGLWSGVGGGADAVIAFNLSQMLSARTTPLGRPADSGGIGQYDYVGLVEDDVLLPPDWFETTVALFDAGRTDGLEVGAVSARCYEDRILVQRDGYALCHNLGAGMVIFSRRAAELVLEHFRTGWTLANRRVFAQLSGRDIGPWWAFRGGAHSLGADWHFDTVLAAHGLASLALTPSRVEMLGQDPPLERQGLAIAAEPVAALRDAEAFDIFCERTEEVRAGTLQVPFSRFRRDEDGGTTIFPHQISQLFGGAYQGDWRLRWCQGWGPFVWEAGEPRQDYVVGAGIGLNGPTVFIPVSGPCIVHVSGGKSGGRARISDEATGFDSEIDLPPEESGNVLSVAVPAGVAYRAVRVTALTPGVCFFGITTREPQPWLPSVKFDHSVLPPVG